MLGQSAIGRSWFKSRCTDLSALINLVLNVSMLLLPISHVNSPQ